MAEEKKVTNKPTGQRVSPAPKAPPLPEEAEVEYEYVEVEGEEEDGVEYEYVEEAVEADDEPAEDEEIEYVEEFVEVEGEDEDGVEYEYVEEAVEADDEPAEDEEIEYVEEFVEVEDEDEDGVEYEYVEEAVEAEEEPAEDEEIEYVEEFVEVEGEEEEDVEYEYVEEAVEADDEPAEDEEIEYVEEFVEVEGEDEDGVEYEYVEEAVEADDEPAEDEEIEYVEEFVEVEGKGEDEVEYIEEVVEAEANDSDDEEFEYIEEVAEAEEEPAEDEEVEYVEEAIEAEEDTEDGVEYEYVEEVVEAEEKESETLETEAIISAKENLDAIEEPENAEAIETAEKATSPTNEVIKADEEPVEQLVDTLALEETTPSIEEYLEAEEPSAKDDKIALADKPAEEEITIQDEAYSPETGSLDVEDIEALLEDTIIEDADEVEYVEEVVIEEATDGTASEEVEYQEVEIVTDEHGNQMERIGSDIIGTSIKVQKTTSKYMDSLNEKNSRRYSRGYGKRKYEFNEKNNILWVDYDYLEDIESFQLTIYQSNVISLAGKAGKTLSIPKISNNTVRDGLLISPGVEPSAFGDIDKIYVPDDKTKLVQTEQDCHFITSALGIYNLDDWGLIVRDTTTLTLANYTGRIIHIPNNSACMIIGMGDDILHFTGATKIVINKRDYDAPEEYLTSWADAGFFGVGNYDHKEEKAPKDFIFTNGQESTEFEGRKGRDIIHIHTGPSLYGWNVAFNNGIRMSLRDVREYQSRHDKLPDGDGIISRGASTLKFRGVKKIVVYEPPKYCGYGYGSGSKG